MSEQKLVSPLLDGFQMGDPISDHDGVRCCPAIKENSDHKYIVKILSIPASQSQLDALLLAGAFQDAAGALEYFKDLADGVAQEIKLHQQLARLDGFVPCDAWQIVPMDNNQLGYEVYLLTPYHRTLERHTGKAALTHLEAVNLGLDLCAALTACRRTGHLYVDLKPSNIFIASDREFLIGDLGFMSMDSLKYAALPSKYRSAYTAPEMNDALSVISDTADIYALGLIMYQVYNDGQLPAPVGEDGVMAAPANADYEMAEIIMKACASDPAARWQDPAQMGQALVAYMQRNTVNDVPIMPPDLTPAEPEEEEIAEDEVMDGEQTETAEESAAVENAENAEESECEETDTEEETQETETEETVEETEEETETTEETKEEEASEMTEEEETEPGEESPVSEELAFMDSLESDEVEPGEDAEEVLENAAISEEASAILAQADELATLEVPEPVVVTAPQLSEEEEPAAEEASETQPESESEPDPEDEDDSEDEVDIPIAIPDLAPIKKTGKKWLVTLIIFALLLGVGYASSYYYQNYYQVPVESITLEGGSDEITADITVDFDEALITAVCTDTYGNTVTSPVENGKAHFTGLNPGTQYTVTLQVDSFNQLVGNNTASFTTDQQIRVVSIAATTGAEDGDVILSFTVDGFDPQYWTVEYATEGADAQTVDFSGHMVTIPGLTVGAPYTFTLSPTEQPDVSMVGQTSLEFTASKVILAQDVSIDSLEEDVLTLVWNAPKNTEVASWVVRCTADGYDETVTVSEPAAQFSGIELGKTYSIEILADGMTQSSRTEVTATHLTITNLEAAMVNDYTLRVTWEYEGEAPAKGWSVRYAIDGGKTVEKMVTDTNAADLSLVVPNASYKISVQGMETAAAESITYETPSANKLTGTDLSYSFCVTPSKDKWDHTDVKKYTKSFTAKQSISLVVFASKELVDSDSTRVLYVVRNSDGKVMSDLCDQQTFKNKTMWKDSYFYPTLPNTPKETGDYTLEIYFDGVLAVRKGFEIVK